MTILESWGLATYSEIGLVSLVMTLLPFVILVLLGGVSIDGNGDAIPLHRRVWRKHILPLPLLGVFIQSIILHMPLTLFNWLGMVLFMSMIYFGGIFIYKIMVTLEGRNPSLTLQERIEHNVE